MGTLLICTLYHKYRTLGSPILLYLLSFCDMQIVSLSINSDNYENQRLQDLCSYLLFYLPSNIASICESVMLGLCPLPRRHVNVATPAWQRCYAGMATLLRRHGNVVMPAWQRMMRHVA